MTTEKPRETSDLERAPEEHPFDDLARGLEGGELSRSSALKLMGAAVLGGALGSLSLPKQAEAGRRRQAPIRYHNGPLMLGGANIYLIWYGAWEGSATPPILIDMVSNLGGSSYFNINTTYHDGTGARPLNQVTFAGSINDMYSSGAALTEADLPVIVARAINNVQLPNDPSGIYFVMTSADVTMGSGNSAFCTSYCGIHRHANINGSPIKYAFVGSPARCPTKCAPQTVDPNGTLEADAMATIVANLISATVTNPEGTGWFDRRGRENSDKCAGKFGRTYTVAKGAKANVRLGNRDYLLQKNWVNVGKGYCALRYP